jgi:hypothetical protein
MSILLVDGDEFKIIKNGHLLTDEDEVTPQDVSELVRVRIETVYRWLKHPVTFLPHRKEGFIDSYKFYIKVKDLKEYFKLKKEVND